MKKFPFVLRILVRLYSSHLSPLIDVALTLSPTHPPFSCHVTKLQQYHECLDIFHKGPYWCYKDLPLNKMKAWLFEANNNGQKVTIKFARSYGKYVHILLPKELFVTQLQHY